MKKFCCFIFDNPNYPWHDPNHCTTDLIHFYCAEQYVQEKFDATNKEIDAWIRDNVNKFLRYNKEGDPCECGDYYDRSIIESFDFINNSLFRHERILSGSIILSGPEASKRLREKYKLEKDCKWHGWTIEHLLSEMTSLVSNTPDKNGMLLTTKSLRINAHTKENTVTLSVSEPYANLFYLEEEINNCSAIIPSDYRYVGFQELRQQSPWNEYTKEEVISVLKKQNQERILSVFDPVNYCIFYQNNLRIADLNKCRDIISNSHYIANPCGEEAQKSIEEEIAVFRLSEIMNVEKLLFPESQEEKKHKFSILDQRKELFIKTVEKYKQEGDFPLNKTKFVKTAIKIGIEEALFRKNDAPSIDVLERNLSELGKRREMPRFKELKAQLNAEASTYKKKMTNQHTK